MLGDSEHQRFREAMNRKDKFARTSLCTLALCIVQMLRRGKSVPRFFLKSRVSRQISTQGRPPPPRPQPGNSGGESSGLRRLRKPLFGRTKAPSGTCFGEFGPGTVKDVAAFEIRRSSLFFFKAILLKRPLFIFMVMYGVLVSTRGSFSTGLSTREPLSP